MNAHFLENPFLSKGVPLYLRLLKRLEKTGLPLLLLFIRLWMAKIFWYSGLTKISHWQSTLFLFKEEYKVPLLPPEGAAFFATLFELTCPLLLLLGFATRVAALPMLAMIAVIQFTYLDLVEHYYWAMLLALIVCYGPGALSLDHFISKKFSKQ